MKILVNDLKRLWEQEGTWGKWREELRKGYEENETYFEFGLMLNHKGIDVKIVLNHYYHINLVSSDMIARDVTLSKSNLNEVTFEDRSNVKIYHIPSATYYAMVKDAQMIYDEYKIEETICFWSIPNKWFADKALIKFINEKISPGLSENWPRRDFYWP